MTFCRTPSLIIIAYTFCKKFRNGSTRAIICIYLQKNMRSTLHNRAVLAGGNWDEVQQ